MTFYQVITTNHLIAQFLILKFIKKEKTFALAFITIITSIIFLSCNKITDTTSLEIL